MIISPWVSNFQMLIQIQSQHLDIFKLEQELLAVELCHTLPYIPSTKIAIFYKKWLCFAKNMSTEAKILVFWQISEEENRKRLTILTHEMPFSDQKRQNRFHDTMRQIIRISICRSITSADRSITSAAKSITSTAKSITSTKRGKNW